MVGFLWCAKFWCAHTSGFHFRYIWLINSWFASLGSGKAKWRGMLWLAWPHICSSVHCLFPCHLAGVMDSHPQSFLQCMATATDTGTFVQAGKFPSQPSRLPCLYHMSVMDSLENINFQSSLPGCTVLPQWCGCTLGSFQSGQWGIRVTAVWTWDWDVLLPPLFFLFSVKGKTFFFTFLHPSATELAKLTCMKGKFHTIIGRRMGWAFHFYFTLWPLIY